MKLSFAICSKNVANYPGFPEGNRHSFRLQLLQPINSPPVGFGTIELLVNKEDFIKYNPSDVVEADFYIGEIK